MFSTKILIQIIFKNDLLFIFDDLNHTKKTLENFNNSYLKFNFFLKFLPDQKTFLYMHTEVIVCNLLFVHPLNIVNLSYFGQIC